MATPADQRILELMGKWLESLELHAKYSSLDDDSYWSVQPWVEHQRPSRWIVDLAKQKTMALRAQVEERIKTGDAQFSGLSQTNALTLWNRLYHRIEVDG